MVTGLRRHTRGVHSMFIAMNRFKVLKDCTQDFENVWFSRESYLHELPGFMAFHLLRGPEKEDHILYSSHTVWRSHADFEAWTKSEAFRMRGPATRSPPRSATPSSRASMSCRK
jgi:heme-degrading monooxygenase HmoA